MCLAERLETKRGGGHSTPNRSRYRLAARLRASVGLGGLRIAAAICHWPSIDRRIILVSSIARQAASSAAEKTKAVRGRPRISAARFRRVITSCGNRASRRALVWDARFMLVNIRHFAVYYTRPGSGALLWRSYFC